MAARIAVYTGARTGGSAAHVHTAHRVGETLARAGIGVVYGGGRVGLMGALADGALAHDGEVIGVIPASLVERELAHPGVSRLEIVDDLHQRKARMSALADAFVALPGGAGTLDEWFEAWTWRHLGVHDKPIALLNGGGFWHPLLTLIDDLVDRGFIDPGQRDAIQVLDDPSQVPGLLDRSPVAQPAATADTTRHPAADDLAHADRTAR